jgi:hypothetical protein
MVTGIVLACGCRQAEGHRRECEWHPDSIRDLQRLRRIAAGEDVEPQAGQVLAFLRRASCVLLCYFWAAKPAIQAALETAS